MDADGETEGLTEEEADPVAGVQSTNNHMVVTRRSLAGVFVSLTPIWVVSRSAFVHAVVEAPGKS